MTINFTLLMLLGMGIVANKKLAGDLAWPDSCNSSTVTFTCRRGATSCTDTQKLFPKAKLRQFGDSSLVLQMSQQCSRGADQFPEADFVAGSKCGRAVQSDA